MEIGARLRALRTARGLTLADVAGSTLSIGLVSKLERDLVRASLDTLCHVAEQLGVGPGSLLVTDAEAASRRARGALAAARAHLLLGDPSAAVAAAGAAHALLPVDANTALRARLLAVAADGSLAGGNAGQAAVHVRDASALKPPVDAQAEIAWVLGALERRRGALGDAERTWSSCLATLEEPPHVHPWWALLRASVLAELGGLAEARGDAERARNLVARAASIAAGLSQASAPAGALLAAWSNAPSPVVTSDGADDEPPIPAAALTLAVVSAAERLARRLTLEAARLERVVWAPESRTPAPDAPASRGLRRA